MGAMYESREWMIVGEGAHPCSLLDMIYISIAPATQEWETSIAILIYWPIPQTLALCFLKISLRLAMLMEYEYLINTPIAMSGIFSTKPMMVLTPEEFDSLPPALRRKVSRLPPLLFLLVFCFRPVLLFWSSVYFCGSNCMRQSRPASNADAPELSS
jgi:hypothetical protein